MSSEKYDKMILGDDCIVSTDSGKTGRNNHVLVIGGSGSGKTHSVVEPTLMETNDASIVISDPKGRLIRKYAAYMEKKGYRVRTLDFNNPEKSPTGYDPLQMLSNSTNLLYDWHPEFKRIHLRANEQDVLSLAHLIIRNDPSHHGLKSKDPFWDDMSEVLLSAFIALVMECMEKPRRTLKEVTSLLELFDYYSKSGIERLNRIFAKADEMIEGSLSARQYKKVKQAPERTLGSIFVSLSSYLGRVTTNGLYTFMQNEDQISPVDLLNEKTALFIQCSDSDSTLYFLVNVFYTQLMQYLFRIKDKPEYENSRPVRFILDDFATNVVVPDMPKWISIMRERDMSVMLILQSVTQLEKIYGEYDARTIVSNCDNIVYLRSNDLKTVMEFSERLDIPTHDLLYTPIGREYVLLAGREPIRTERYNITEHKDYKKVYPGTDKPHRVKAAPAEERGAA